MTKKGAPTEKRIWIDGVRKPYSHYVWHENTGYWPVSGEVVHHIDGGHENNEFSNLQLMSNSEHAHLHNIGRPFSKEHRAKISEAQTGEKGNNWKGNSVTPHAEYMRTWRAQRRADKSCRGGS